MSSLPPVIELLQDLVEIPSPYPDETRIGEFVYGYLKDREGIRVTMQEVEAKRYNIIATKGEGDVSFGLCGHLDTVKKTGTWSVDPFGGKIVDDRLYGLGAYDMKGGVAAMIRAFVDTKPTTSKLILLLTIDEENRAAGCEAFLRSPSAQGVKHLVVCEPGFAHGLRGIVTGRSGWGWINISITQSSRHFNYYDRSVDLSLFFSELTQYIHSLYREEAAYGGRQFIYIRDIDAKGDGLSLPHTLKAQCDCSILLPETGQSLAIKIQDRANTLICEHYPEMVCGVSFDPGAQQYYAPYLSDMTTREYVSLAAAVQQVCGETAIPYFRSSVSDENILAASGISVLGIGPEGYGAHSADEWVSISSVISLEEILKAYLRTLLS